MAEEFGVSLASILKERGITSKQLADALEISYKTVREWIGPHGRMPRNPDSIRKLTQFLGVSTHRLLFGEEDPQGFSGILPEKTEIHTGLYEITIRKVQTIKKG